MLYPLSQLDAPAMPFLRKEMVSLNFFPKFESAKSGLLADTILQVMSPYLSGEGLYFSQQLYPGKFIGL